MPPGPEDIAREQIDRMLVSAGWAVQDAKAVNLYAKQGVDIREFELKSGFGAAKPPFNQPSAMPAKYNWPTLLKKDGDDLFDHYRHMLESLGKGFSPSPLNSSPTIEDPHPYPSPMEGEGQRERGLNIGGAMEKDIVSGKRSARPDLQ